MNDNRIEAMDMAKAIAAVLVITIHVSAFCLVNSNANSYSYKISLILNQISRSSVPLFTLFSGVGLALSYKKGTTYSKFITKRVFKILPGYIVFGLIYLILVSKDLSYKTYFMKFLKGDQVYYHLYYVPMIIKLYLVFPLLYPLMKKKLGLIGSFLITFFITTSAHYFNKPDVSLEIFHKNNILFWLFYFVLGVYIAPNIKKYINYTKKHKSKISVIFLLCSVVIIAESFLSIGNKKTLDYCTTFIRPSILIYSLVTTAFLFSLNYENKKIHKFLKVISKNSYEVYLCHPLVIFYYMKLYKRLNFNIGSIHFLISSLLVSLFTSLIISIFLKNTKKYLI